MVMKIKRKALTIICLILAVSLLFGCAEESKSLPEVGEGKYVGIEIRNEDPEFVRAISLSLDRVYSEEKVTGEGLHPAKTLFLKEGGYDPERTGILYIGDTMALLNGLGFSFNTKGDGMFDISPKKTIKCEVRKEDAAAIKIARELPSDKAIIINMSGRGDKDVFITSPVFRKEKWLAFLKSEIERLEDSKDIHDARLLGGKGE